MCDEGPGSHIRRTHIEKRGGIGYAGPSQMNIVSFEFPFKWSHDREHPLNKMDAVWTNGTWMVSRMLVHCIERWSNDRPEFRIGTNREETLEDKDKGGQHDSSREASVDPNKITDPGMLCN